MLKQIIEHLNQHPKGKVLFDEPVVIECLCTIYGAWASGMTLWLMDGGAKWHLLTEGDQNFELVASAIKERLMPAPSFDEAMGEAM